MLERRSPKDMWRFRRGAPAKAVLRACCDCNSRSDQGACCCLRLLVFRLQICKDLLLHRDGCRTVCAMCGIVGYVGTRDARNVVVDALRRMEYRGYDSAGVALVNGAAG